MWENITNIKKVGSVYLEVWLLCIKGGRVLKENIWIWEGDGRLERLHYHVLHDLYFSLNIIGVIKPMRMRRPVHVPRMAVKQNLHKISSPDPEANGSLGRERLKRKNNIKTDL